MKIQIQRTPGNVHIDSASDARFRHFLVNACHSVVKPEMERALANKPFPPTVVMRLNAHFGDRQKILEAVDVCNVIMRECERYCHGLSEWMRLTGYANEPLMIAAFLKWAEHPVDYSALPTTRLQ